MAEDSIPGDVVEIIGRTGMTGEATQVAYLLSGISQKGLGNKAAAKAAFDAGYQMDASTDTAKLIDQQRKAL